MDALVGSCEETREQLSAHVEGELTGLQRLRVRVHLDDAFAPDPAPSVAPSVLERIQRLDRG